MSPSPRAIADKTREDRSRVVQEDKVEKLRDYFENIRLTPVKKVAIGMCMHYCRETKIRLWLGC